MRLLLDTMTIIYLVQQPAIVPASTLAVLEDAGNELFISLVSPWEMQIKVGIGKLALGQPVAQTITTEVANRNIALLAITLDHIDALSHLADHHRDPFDRLLIAQAVHENLTIVTSDETIARYPVPTLW
jgi:PIN domain nuclease of toxin-antitoxin system